MFQWGGAVMLRLLFDLEAKKIPDRCSSSGILIYVNILYRFLLLSPKIR